jgi:hypothetical protein
MLLKMISSYTKNPLIETKVATMPKHHAMKEYTAASLP